MSDFVKEIEALKAAGLDANQIKEIMLAKANSNTYVAPNTIDSMRTEKMDKTVNAQLHRITNHKKFKSEPKVKVSVPVPYGAYVGGFINLGINGIVIELPCDGIEREVPLSFAKALKQRLANLDAMNSKDGLRFENLTSDAGIHQLKTGTHKLKEV